MPNSFTVFPNVLPGNVTIGGNLTVGGDQLRIGAAAPFTRLGKDAGGNSMWSTNLGFDGATIDSAGTNAWRLLLATSVVLARLERVNNSGVNRFEALTDAIFTDYTVHSHTGTVTIDTIYSKTIPANTLGANGAIRLRFKFTNSVQGAGSTTVAVSLGGSNLVTFSLTAAGQDSIVEVEIFNQNNAAQQLAFGYRIQISNGTVTAFTGSTAQDTTTDKVLAVTVQNANTTDTQTFQYAIAHQLNSFGPV